MLGYLTSTALQQRDALPVLATVLDMSPDERTRAGITRDGAIGEGERWPDVCHYLDAVLAKIFYLNTFSEYSIQNCLLDIGYRSLISPATLVRARNAMVGLL